MAEMEADKIPVFLSFENVEEPFLSLFVAKAHCLGYGLHLHEEAEEQG